MVTFRDRLGTMGARRGPVSAYALLAPCAPGGGVRARRSGMQFAISRPRTRTCRPRSDIWSTTWARGTRQKGFVPPRTGTHWYLANCVPRSYEGVMCGHAGPAVVFGCCRAWLCVQGLLALHFSQHLAGTPPWVCSEVGAPTSSGNHAPFGSLGGCLGPSTWCYPTCGVLCGCSHV